jgi:hypothetical protein
VRAEIWRDLNEMEIINTPNWWQALFTEWKLNKTARSLVTHTNNVVSNVALLDMADVHARDLVAAVRAMAKNTDIYKEAVENGAFGSDMVAQEIRRDILQPILDEIEKIEAAGANITAMMRIVNRVLDGIFSRGMVTGAAYGAAAGSAVGGPAGAVIGAGIGAVGGALAHTQVSAFDKAMINAYQMEDEFFRMATYIRRRQQGMSPMEAGVDARDQFLNYDIRAPWVNSARRSVLPFAAYTYRAVPIMAKTAMVRPWKIAKYMLLAYGVNQLAYMLAPSDDDEDRERRSMRKEEQGTTWIQAPRMLRMPYVDENGNPVFLDIRRWIPAGDVFDVNQNSPAIDLPGWIQPTGPVLMAFELALNKQAFTGKEITNDKTDDFWDKASKIGDYAWKGWMPSAAWVPGSWYWTKIEDAIKGVREKGTDRPTTVPQAVLQSVGVKLKAQDVQQGFENHGYEFDAIERALKKEINTLKKDRKRGKIDESDYKEAFERLQRKRQNLRQEKREVFQGAD